MLLHLAQDTGLSLEGTCQKLERTLAGAALAVMQIAHFLLSNFLTAKHHKKTPSSILTDPRHALGLMRVAVDSNMLFPHGLKCSSVTNKHCSDTGSPAL